MYEVCCCTNHGEFWQRNFTTLDEAKAYADMTRLKDNADVWFNGNCIY